MHRAKFALAVLAASLIAAGSAQACHVGGYVICDSNGQPLPGIRIDLVATDGTDTPLRRLERDRPLRHRPPVRAALLPDHRQHAERRSRGVPASGSYEFCAEGGNNYVVEPRDWRLTSPDCPQVEEKEGCWLTAAARSSPASRAPTAATRSSTGAATSTRLRPAARPGRPVEHDRRRPEPALPGLADRGRALRQRRRPRGRIGVARHAVQLHRVPGTGTLKGVKGNDADFGTVHFWAHVQDRNEPGSRGMRDAAGKDRIYMNVFTNRPTRSVRASC